MDFRKLRIKCFMAVTARTRRKEQENRKTPSARSGSYWRDEKEVEKGREGRGKDRVRTD